VVCIWDGVWRVASSGGRPSGYFTVIWQSLGGGPLCEIERLGMAAIISRGRIDIPHVHQDGGAWGGELSTPCPDWTKQQPLQIA